MCGKKPPQYIYFPLIPEKLSKSWQVYRDEKEGVTANTSELAAYLRQRRTSWETRSWRTQATDLIDVALLRASACLNNGSCLGPCQKTCIGVSTSGKYVANLFCCGTVSKPTEGWTSNLEKTALL